MFKNKAASFVAYNWEEYSSQGPGYKEIENWWKLNAVALPGEYSSDYASWTSWYRNKYHNEWSSAHRHPSEVLRILQTEKANPPNVGIIDSIRNRRRTVRDITRDRRSRGGGNYKKSVNSNPHADIDNISEGMKEFLVRIGEVATSRGLQKPYVTSGFRSTRSQIRAMANNWNKYGGGEIVSDQVAQERAKNQNTVRGIRSKTRNPINLGLIYLYELYGDKEMAVGVNDVFMDIGTNRQGIKAGAEYWDSLGRPKKSHLASPATSVDLRLTSGIKEILDEVKQSGEFDLKVLYENDHYHVRVYS